MTPEERAAIEARDAEWVEQCGWDPPWRPSPDDWDSDAMPDRHALLDELRRVEQKIADTHKACGSCKDSWEAQTEQSDSHIEALEAETQMMREALKEISLGLAYMQSKQLAQQTLAEIAGEKKEPTP